MPTQPKSPSHEFWFFKLYHWFLTQFCDDVEICMYEIQKFSKIRASKVVRSKCGIWCGFVICSFFSSSNIHNFCYRAPRDIRFAPVHLACCRLLNGCKIIELTTIISWPQAAKSGGIFPKPHFPSCLEASYSVCTCSWSAHLIYFYTLHYIVLKYVF